MEWHITISVEERRSICSSDADRLEVARVCARTGGDRTILFCGADEHAHLVLRADRKLAGRIAAAVSQGLRRIAGVAMDPARIREVNGRSHLQSLVRYVLDQSTHHRLATAVHPALWQGSSFLDLVGARILPGFTPAALREALPRLTSAEVWGAVGLEPVEPASDELVSGLGVDALIRACCGAAGVARPRAEGRSALRARRLAVSLAARLGVPLRRVREALELPGRTLRRHATAPADPLLERAVRQWIAVHEASRAG